MPNKVDAHILLSLYLMIDNFHNTIIPYDGKNAGISIWNGQNISINELSSISILMPIHCNCYMFTMSLYKSFFSHTQPALTETLQITILI